MQGSKTWRRAAAQARSRCPGRDNRKRRGCRNCVKRQGSTIQSVTVELRVEAADFCGCGSKTSFVVLAVTQIRQINFCGAAVGRNIDRHYSCG
ncbi:hypothetical protein K461DRAFT_27225 [Myriangium duriaei CBS 260.36]|uniref:Uncharacterized protein n=1 Tax=Myriangium duriaei CBS 260.36 TaxID=1168546 RepID=A0A9P4MM14_9PEZI|nr:hypothetical protein K461DRAFT_27225 [Myriangium duriaei CBS 260.36]